MAKNKRKVTATTMRGKAIMCSYVPDDHDHDRSACSLCLAIILPIPEVAPIPNPLETVIVEDCSVDEGLDKALLE